MTAQIENAASEQDPALALDRGRACIAAGQIEDAARWLNYSLALDARQSDAWHLLAALAFQTRQYDDAVFLASKAIELRPAAAEYHNMLGRCHKAAGRIEQALACYRKALELNPRYPQALTSLGVALRALGRTEEAVAYYRQALEIEPGSEEARQNLGNALLDLGRRAEGEELRRQAQRTLESRADEAHERGQAFVADNRFSEALAAFEEVVRLQPDAAPHVFNVGAVLESMHRYDEALAMFERALALDPSFVLALTRAGAVHALQGDGAEASRYYLRALAVQPSDGLRISLGLLAPAINGSRQEIMDFRRAHELALDDLLARDLRLDDPLQETQVFNFYLSYHGLPDRGMFTKQAAMFLKACPGLNWTAPHCRRPGSHAGRSVAGELGTPRNTGAQRIKVGFVSHFMHNHSIGKTTRGLVAGLSRERFEVHAVFLPPRVDDEISRFISESADRVTVVDGSLARAREQIAALELDVLFFQDIGMEAGSYFLAFARLAPVQCVSFGHPDTTGIPNMDYFISNDLFESDGAHEHYSEKLVLLRDLATLAYYYRPQRSGAPKRRADFGLPDDATLYLCPQTLFKLHPDFDQLAAEILHGDPRGRLVLIEGKFPIWAQHLRERLQNSLPDCVERIAFVPQQSTPDFYELLALADVILDTVHFNGMNTSLEAFAMGTPVVTLPTALQRGRHTQAMYRKMGIEDCIARDPEDYVAIALRLGQDPVYRQALSQRIRSGCAVLYEDPRVLREFERFFLEAVEAREGERRPA